MTARVEGMTYQDHEIVEDKKATNAVTNSTLIRK
jgi:hypothetical protein